MPTQNICKQNFSKKTETYAVPCFYFFDKVKESMQKLFADFPSFFPIVLRYCNTRKINKNAAINVNGTLKNKI